MQIYDMVPQPTSPVTIPFKITILVNFFKDGLSFQGRPPPPPRCGPPSPLEKAKHTHKLQFTTLQKEGKCIAVPLPCIHNYLTLSPRGVSLSRNTTLTVSSPDARIIPLDSMPQRVAGFKFATTMIFLPIRSSG